MNTEVTAMFGVLMTVLCYKHGLIDAGDAIFIFFIALVLKPDSSQVKIEK